MHPATHSIKPISASLAVRRVAEKMTSLPNRGNGPGAWVNLNGDVWARRWAGAPAAGIMNGTVEIVRVTE